MYSSQSRSRSAHRSSHQQAARSKSTGCFQDSPYQDRFLFYESATKYAECQKKPAGRDARVSGQYGGYQSMSSHVASSCESLHYSESSNGALEHGRGIPADPNVKSGNFPCHLDQDDQKDPPISGPGSVVASTNCARAFLYEAGLVSRHQLDTLPSPDPSRDILPAQTNQVPFREKNGNIFHGKGSTYETNSSSVKTVKLLHECLYEVHPVAVNAIKSPLTSEKPDQLPNNQELTRSLAMTSNLQSSPRVTQIEVASLRVSPATTVGLTPHNPLCCTPGALTESHVGRCQRCVDHTKHELSYTSSLLQDANSDTSGSDRKTSTARIELRTQPVSSPVLARKICVIKTNRPSSNLKSGKSHRVDEWLHSVMQLHGELEKNKHRKSGPRDLDSSNIDVCLAQKPAELIEPDPLPPADQLNRDSSLRRWSSTGTNTDVSFTSTNISHSDAIRDIIAGSTPAHGLSNLKHTATNSSVERHRTTPSFCQHQTPIYQSSISKESRGFESAVTESSPSYSPDGTACTNCTVNCVSTAQSIRESTSIINLETILQGTRSDIALNNLIRTVKKSVCQHNSEITIRVTGVDDHHVNSTKGIPGSAQGSRYIDWISDNMDGASDLADHVVHISPIGPICYMSPLRSYGLHDPAEVRDLRSPRNSVSSICSELSGYSCPSSTADSAVDMAPPDDDHELHNLQLVTGLRHFSQPSEDETDGPRKDLEEGEDCGRGQGRYPFMSSSSHRNRKSSRIKTSEPYKSNTLTHEEPRHKVEINNAFVSTLSKRGDAGLRKTGVSHFRYPSAYTEESSGTTEGDSESVRILPSPLPLSSGILDQDQLGSSLSQSEPRNQPGFHHSNPVKGHQTFSALHKKIESGHLKPPLPQLIISDHSDVNLSPDEDIFTEVLSPGSSVYSPSGPRSAGSFTCSDLDLLEAEGLHVSRSLSTSSLSSVASTCSTCTAQSDSEPDSGQRKQSSWRKIRSFILWSPFIQVFKKHRYPWIQLAGHQGNFQAGEAGSVLKKLDPREAACFQQLMTDSLKQYVPEYRGDVDKNGDTYIQLQDLLSSFSHPCVMDVKMGVRTYLEDELQKARKSPSLRKDMYQKMIEIDSTAPTTEEHELKAVTKPRYMQWRDEMSSSVELGFRLEGIKKSDGNSSKDFKKIKSRESVIDIMKSFVGGNENIVIKYIQRLQELMATQETSQFFMSHEIIGSSLLFVHDADENVGVWMIDFGKSESLPNGVTIDHRSSWIEGNHEDGYLFGLDNLISIFEEVQKSVMSSAV